MVHFDSIEYIAIISKDNAILYCLDQNMLHKWQYHYIAFYECVYYHESEEINTLQTERSDNST